MRRRRGSSGTSRRSGRSSGYEAAHIPACNPVGYSFRIFGNDMRKSVERRGAHQSPGLLLHEECQDPPSAFTGPSILSALAIILLTNCLWTQVMNGRVITTAFLTPSSR